MRQTQREGGLWKSSYYLVVVLLLFFLMGLKAAKQQTRSCRTLEHCSSQGRETLESDCMKSP